MVNMLTGYTMFEVVDLILRLYEKDHWGGAGALGSLNDCFAALSKFEYI
jgi:hypothetical protein